MKHHAMLLVLLFSCSVFAACEDGPAARADSVDVDAGGAGPGPGGGRGLGGGPLSGTDGAAAPGGDGPGGIAPDALGAAPEARASTPEASVPDTRPAYAGCGSPPDHFQSGFSCVSYATGVGSMGTCYASTGPEGKLPLVYGCCTGCLVPGPGGNLFGVGATCLSGRYDQNHCGSDGTACRACPAGTACVPQAGGGPGGRCQ